MSAFKAAPTLPIPTQPHHTPSQCGFQTNHPNSETHSTRARVDTYHMKNTYCSDLRLNLEALAMRGEVGFQDRYPLILIILIDTLQPHAPLQSCTNSKGI